MKIKVCGMRHATNIAEVEALGIDMMGFIFYPKSPRYVATQPDYLPSSCWRVGVFVDAIDDFIAKHVEMFRLDALQLHGHETPDRLSALKKRFAIPVIKALSVADELDTVQASAYGDIADMLVFDTSCQTMGGSGVQFDWNVLMTYEGRAPFLLSGGIGPDDAMKVKAFVHPKCIGVDVNSRFELAPAQKNVQTLSQFIKQIRHEPYK